MEQKLVVFDPGIDLWLSNNIFNIEFARENPGASQWPVLAELLRNHGIEIETIDCFLSRKSLSNIDACLLVMVNKITDSTSYVIQNKLAYPGVCICLEPPLIALDFYHNLSEYSSVFRHIYAFSGALSRINQAKCVFHPIVWPYDPSTTLLLSEWSGRKFLTLINSNRRAQINLIPEFNLRHFRSSIKVIRDHKKSRSEYLNDPWIGEELYLKRIEAIKFFSKNSTIDLYGYGWEKPVPGINQADNLAIAQAYKGMIPAGQKLNILLNYKYCICFENSYFPGYITEKILDCFYAGAIPIYLGAPDINKYIPTDTFINFSDFATFDMLNKYLLELSINGADDYITAQRAFINSKEYNIFNSDLLAHDLFSSINEVFSNNDPLNGL
jgi:hypothetical protein